MKNLLILFFLMVQVSFAQDIGGFQYSSLDKKDPILFCDDKVIYKGDTIVLGPKTFFIDGSLPKSICDYYPYVYQNLNDAVLDLTPGTELEPMVLLLAPWVYWVDDPDDMFVRNKKGGKGPFALTIRCPWLKLYGLTENAENVVLACNRGQQQGSNGNFTMFDFYGDGLSVYNLTMGNYCNVDLVYPLNNQMNRKKRMEAITQAQLAFCNGADKILAVNTRFISRLNLCPLVGGKRTFFYKCYFECTDDALAGRGVYEDCKFVFWNSKPFYRTEGNGAFLLNCDIEVQTLNKQFLCKRPSPVTMVDCRFTTKNTLLDIGWTQDPVYSSVCYQYNVTLNGCPYYMQSDMPEVTVDMNGLSMLDAFRVEDPSIGVLYNTYNLLREDDDWDPAGIKDKLLKVSLKRKNKFVNVPISMKLSPEFATLETGKDTLLLTVSAFSHLNDTDVHWDCIRNANIVHLFPQGSTSCKIIGCNNGDNAEVVIRATTKSGLRAYSVLTVTPSMVKAPIVTDAKLYHNEKNIVVDYGLGNETYRDNSLITWYRSKQPNGCNSLKVAVSRGKPLKEYKLTKEDIGYYLQCVIEPKFSNSPIGQPLSLITEEPVKETEVVKMDVLETDFHNLPTDNQPLILSGFWTLDGAKSPDMRNRGWALGEGPYWKYDKGVDGGEGVALQQAAGGARLRYTPIDSNIYHDMRVSLLLSPCKLEGQGFPIPGEFMDVYIKLNTSTMSGYGVRIERTTKYHKAVDFTLMKFEEGKGIPISKSISSTCFRTGCTLIMEIVNGKFQVKVSTKAPPMEYIHDGILKDEVQLDSFVEDNPWGGFGIQYTLSGGDSATLLHHLKMEWLSLENK